MLNNILRIVKTQPISIWIPLESAVIWVKSEDIFH